MEVASDVLRTERRGDKLRRVPVNVPLGRGKGISKFPGTPLELPAVDPAITNGSPVKGTGEVVRPPAIRVPQVAAKTPTKGVQRPVSVDAGILRAPILQPTGRKAPMALDLGTIVRDLGVAALSRDNQPQYQYASYGSAYPPPPVYVGSGEGFGIPGFDVVDTDDRKNMVYDPNGNCGRGKWIKRRRRRRKRLATKSDKADLAALKGILGQGKAFETWIATHG